MLFKLLVYLMPQSNNGQAFKNFALTGRSLNDDALANRNSETRHSEFDQGSFKRHDNDHAGQNWSLVQHRLKNGNFLSRVQIDVHSAVSLQIQHLRCTYAHRMLSSGQKWQKGIGAALTPHATWENVIEYR